MPDSRVVPTIEKTKTPQAAEPDTARAKPTREHTADLTRVLLFVGVVIAHCVTTINYTPDVIRQTGLVSAALHLTRYGFVAVTLFVLVLSMRGRTMTAREFWRKRFGLIVVPYLVWTLAYSITDHLLLEDEPSPSLGRWLGDLVRTTFTGDAKYQLYFLLISMQIYLLFPALQKLAHRFERHPWTVLLTAGAIQLGFFAFYQYAPRPSGQPWDTLFNHMWKLLPMYVLFVAMGMLAAQHYEKVGPWLRAHALPLVAACLAAGAFSLVFYLRDTEPGVVSEAATSAWNPLYLPWYVAATLLIWLAAMVWDELRASGRAVGERLVSYATVRAFGVFAVHPLMLDILGKAGFFELLSTWFPASALLRTATLVVVVFAMSLLFVDLVLRTPVSRWIVARDRA
ncbi:acyltransferase [Tsukamurella asaccharolytica]|uniref:Acyltransferase n=1 Tax=Tsukamurella asaccharolytica TaxID=2592067 RepID=A0A5C5R7D2_9ACTN|nr:acyltransferase [Tsukamurella asaccharolytica]TWS18738.1 acyltransferase [Tsukamurella asaccharolytica]